MNFVQAHARTKSETPLADSVEPGQETESSIAARRLEEALSRLDQSAGKRRSGPTADSGTPTSSAQLRRHVAEVNEASAPAIPRSFRLPPAAGMELDESVSQSAQLWIEQEDGTQLRVDPPEHANEALDQPAHAIESALRSDAPAEGDASDSVWNQWIGQPIDVILTASPPAVAEAKTSDEPDTIGVNTEAADSASAAEPPVPPESTAASPKSSAASPESTVASPVSTAASPAWVPAWQVPAFPLPEIAEALFMNSETDVCQQLARRLADAHRSGLETIAITSVQPGEGRSTVALGLALSVALSGLRVALVDADPDGGTLAGDLSLELDHGWIDAIRGDVPLEEIAVASEADQITLIPLLERAGEVPPRPMEIRQLISRLRRQFDLILIDCPPSATEAVRLCHTALIVRDMQRTDTEAVESFALTLRRSGLQGIGVVENFTDRPGRPVDASSPRRKLVN